jgi:hypothetical protein
MQCESVVEIMEELLREGGLFAYHRVFGVFFSILVNAVAFTANRIAALK